MGVEIFVPGIRKLGNGCVWRGGRGGEVSWSGEFIAIMWLFPILVMRC